MPKITRNVTVVQRGVGKPDYSRTVSSSIERAGYRLAYGERLLYLAATFTDQVITPYINPTVLAPLAAGADAHLVDAETGIAGPLTIPAGYIGTLVQWEWTGDQDIETWHYIDTILAGCPGISGPAANFGFNMVFAPSTYAWDPTAASAHLWDVVVINRGYGALEGTIDFGFLLEPIGTDPFPTTKICKCPFCGNEEEKPVTSTSVDCPNCGKRYILWDLSSVKKIG